MLASFAAPRGVPLSRARRGAVCARRAARRRPALRASAGAPAALILDCDGVIVESEELHRKAYNATWSAFDLGFEWSSPFYGELQNAVGGGRAKMQWYFDREGWPARASSETERNALLDELVSAKTAIYLDRISHGVPARPGITRVIDEALSRGVPVAVASAANRAACHAVLAGTLGEERVGRLAFVLAGDDIARKKPFPDIYAASVERLGVPGGACVVVEDSLIGVQAAVAAGLAVAVTYTAYTKDQDFTQAAAVFPSLGGPDAPDDKLVGLDELLALRPGVAAT